MGCGLGQESRMHLETSQENVNVVTSYWQTIKRTCNIFKGLLQKQEDVEDGERVKNLLCVCFSRQRLVQVVSTDSNIT